MTCTSVIGAAALLISTPLCAGLAQARDKPGTGPARIIGSTVLIGTADMVLWTSVLEVLPARPTRIVILSLGSLPAAARQRVRGLQAFVLQGSATVFVLRDAASLRQAESGDRFDRLVLASVLFHEMSHAKGLDERAALEAEQRLWREFVRDRRVDAGLAMTYIQRLEEERGRVGLCAPGGLAHTGAC